MLRKSLPNENAKPDRDALTYIVFQAWGGGLVLRTNPGQISVSRKRLKIDVWYNFSTKSGTGTRYRLE